MESTFWQTILQEWAEKTLPATYTREKEIDLQSLAPLKKIRVITGFRRTGKTYLVFTAINKILKNYTKKDVLYVNFEDERLPLRTETLTGLLPAFQSFFGQKPKYLFLDEVQNMPLWSKYIRRVLDNENIQIFLTGSSSKMSSFELPTELRGRSLEQKVWPLTFIEFLTFKGDSFDKKGLDFSDDQRARFNFLLNEYLIFGTLPEVVLASVENKANIIQEYFKTVIRREIMERYQLKKEEPVKNTAKLLFNSTYFTLSKIYRDLVSQGIKLDKNTVGDYFDYLSAAYLFTPVSHFSFSLRNRMTKPQKAYFIDNGFISCLSTKFSQNFGRLWENMVCRELLSKDKEVYYYQNDRKTDEVDFVVCDDGKPTSLIQACYDLSDSDTQKREVGTLLRVGKKLNCQKLQILVPNTFNAPMPKEIEIITAKDFLL